MPDVVTFHYTLRDPEGRMIDTSRSGDPISYLEGAGQIIDGLAEALQNLTAGTSARIGVPAGTSARIGVPAAKAYGERDDTQVHRVLRSLLPVDGELQAGDRFQTDSDPQAPIVTVMGVDGDHVLLDANHPLAGVDLTFDVEVIAKRPAQPEELEHGHAHGADGHGHC